MESEITCLSRLVTPCYILDEAELRRGIAGFRTALKDKFERVEIGYSVKTNSLPYALNIARQNGCKAEVVSHDEYQLARLCGYQPSEIIYNGPLKSKETFLEAIVGGAIVNIETKRELSWLAYLPQEGKYSVGLRLNINISDISPEDADGDNDNSRFGFAVASDEFADAVSYLRTLPNVGLAGLHIHRTAHSRSPRFYKRSVEYAVNIIQKYNLELDYLDVGGGYYGVFPNKPTFKEYADAIYSTLVEAGLETLKVIVEPGNALTASAFSFLTEVIDVKRVDKETVFVTTDGSRNDIDPFFRKSDYIKEILYNSDSTTRPKLPLQIIGGCTCLEYDRLFKLVDSYRLYPFDRILYKNVGAYTMTLSPQFIRLWPRVYSLTKEGEIIEARRPSMAADVIGLNTKLS